MFLKVKYRYLCWLVILLISFRIYPQETLKDELIKLDNEYRAYQEKLNLVKQMIDSLRLLLISEDIKNIGLPKILDNEIILHHSAYSLSYDTIHKQAKWVAHIIPPYIIEGNLGRTNDFRPDSLLKYTQATMEDYWESGYDRGHLAPSADFRWSAKAVSESYYYTNMSPQKPEFNRGIWSLIEDALRRYVVNTGRRLFVVTGGILRDGLPTIGQNKVSVPEKFYKIAVDIDSVDKRGIAFLLSNEGSDEYFMSFALPIDSVEILTGLDFFPNLNDSVENIVESLVDVNVWQKLINKDEATPISKSKLPKNCFNTVQAKSLVGKRTTICGKVVSTKYSYKSGNTFINLDKKFPNHIFTVTIWKNDRINFSYKPEEFLKDKNICVRGEIRLFRDIPSMTIKSEDDIIFFDY